MLTGWTAFLPEIVLTAGLLLVIVVDLAVGRRWNGAGRTTALATLAAAALVACWAPSAAEPILGGQLRSDAFHRVFRLFFLGAAAVAALSARLGDGPRRARGEFGAILLGGTLAMSVLVAAADLVTFYLAFELVSISGYLLVGYRRKDARSAEAAAKYVLFGAISSGVMLYGLSLLYGLAGSTALADVGAAAARAWEGGGASAVTYGACVLLLFAGFAYKVSAVPFHFWAPDVYEGAPTAVAGFLAVASKAAGFAALMRVLHAFQVPPVDATGFATFLPSGHFVPLVLAVAAIATMTVGNFAAIRQTDVKRLLAYSSIAHAGYALMALTVMSGAAFEAVVFYLIVYLFFNLGAFYFAALLIRDLGSARIEAFRGAGWTAPGLGVCFAIALIGLTGLPPTAGFLGKFYLFTAVLDANLYGLALVGIVNSVVSLYYYARILRAMYLEHPEGAGRIAMRVPDAVLAVALSGPVLLFGVYWAPVAKWAQDAVKALVP